MQRTKLEELLVVAEKEVEKAQKAATNTKKSADEIARHAAHSPSQSGDRTHSQGQAEITEAYSQRVSIFASKIKEAVGQNADVIQTPCFIQLEFTDGRKSEFFLVEDPIVLSGFSLVSVSSPLGNELIGKKLGASFKFAVNGSSQSGKVVGIE